MPAHSRIARAGWRGVGGICGRACDEVEAQRGASRFDGPGRAGIDETSHERGHKYPAAVVDHDRGCLAWAHEGYGREVLSLFLDEPAREQRRAIEVAAADGAKWTRSLAGKRCPNARWVTGPSRVAGWTSDAPGEAGRGVAGRQEGRPRRDAEARRARQAARGRGDPAGGQGAGGGRGRDRGKPLRAGGVFCQVKLSKNRTRI